MKSQKIISAFAWAFAALCAMPPVCAMQPLAVSTGKGKAPAEPPQTQPRRYWIPDSCSDIYEIIRRAENARALRVAVFTLTSDQFVGAISAFKQNNPDASCQIITDYNSLALTWKLQLRALGDLSKMPGVDLSIFNADGSFIDKYGRRIKLHGHIGVMISSKKPPICWNTTANATKAGERNAQGKTPNHELGLIEYDNWQMLDQYARFINAVVPYTTPFINGQLSASPQPLAALLQPPKTPSPMKQTPQKSVVFTSAQTGFNQSVALRIDRSPDNSICFIGFPKISERDLIGSMIKAAERGVKIVWRFDYSSLYDKNARPLLEDIEDYNNQTDKHKKIDAYAIKPLPSGMDYQPLYHCKYFLRQEQNKDKSFAMLSTGNPTRQYDLNTFVIFKQAEYPGIISRILNLERRSFKSKEATPLSRALVETAPPSVVRVETAPSFAPAPPKRAGVRKRPPGPASGAPSAKRRPTKRMLTY